jgi:hypothetical protein
LTYEDYPVRFEASLSGIERGIVEPVDQRKEGDPNKKHPTELITFKQQEIG